MMYFLCGFVMCTIYLIQDFVEPIETKVFSVAYWNLFGGKNAFNMLPAANTHQL